MPANKPSPNPDGLLPVTGDWHAFVGALWRNEHADMIHPADYCLDDGMLYTGARYRLGRVNVFGAEREIEALERPQAVIVYGQERPNLFAALQLAGPCPDEEVPMAQMRSDWVADEGGYETTRDKLEALSYIQGESALGVTLYDLVDADEMEMRIRIHNPFDAPYTDMSLIAHYEGGPGKPMPHYENQRLNLDPGDSVELTLARTADPDGTRPRTKAGWGLHSIHLRGRAGNAAIDADLIVRHH